MSKLSPMTEAELDRIAAGIRPSWELDDAPFRPGGFASPELDALLNGNGAHAIHTNGASAAIVPQAIVAVAVAQEADLKTTVDPRPPMELVEAPIAPKPKSIPPPTPAARQNGAAKSERAAAVAAQADPFASPLSASQKAKLARPGLSSGATSSSELVAMKKSNTGLYVALGGGALAVIAAIVFFSSPSVKTDTAKVEPSAQQLAASAARAESIPPPPATDEIPTAKATAATAPDPTFTAEAVATAAATQAPTPPSHPTHNAEPPPSHASHPATPSHPPSGGGTKPKGGGIVRDVPF